MVLSRRELSRFIASGRLSAKIDKVKERILSWTGTVVRTCCFACACHQVGGVVETNRPDKKNAQYQEVIKQGDILLNRLSKLARIVDF